jgi:hypothetical protein
MNAIQYVGLAESDSKGELCTQRYNCSSATLLTKNPDTMPSLNVTFSEYNQMCIALHSEPNYSIQLLNLVLHNEQDAVQFKMRSADKRYEELMKDSSNMLLESLKYFLIRYLN